MSNNGNHCSTCKKSIKEGAKWIKCAVCDKKYHLTKECSHHTAEEMSAAILFQEELAWFCMKCRESKPITQIKLIPTLLEDNKAIKQQLASILEKLAGLSANHQSDEPNENEPDLNAAFSSDRPTTSSKQPVRSTLSAAELANEMEERQRRQCNAVIFGLDDIPDASKAATECIRTLGFNETNSPKLVRSFAIRPRSGNGKPLLVIRFGSQAARDDVLRAARKRNVSDAKSHKFFVNPDLTLLQRNHLKDLKTEVKKRNDQAGAREWKIFNDRIVRAFSVQKNKRQPNGVTNKASVDDEANND